MKLLGEDESDPRFHRRPQAVRQAERNPQNTSEQELRHEDLVEGKSWSWMGRKSPLMSGVDEPKWVMDRLIAALDKELEGLAKKRDEGRSA